MHGEQTNYVNRSVLKTLHRNITRLAINTSGKEPKPVILHRHVQIYIANRQLESVIELSEIEK